MAKELHLNSRKTLMKIPVFHHKKIPLRSKGFLRFQKEFAYFLNFAYFDLNLSILPAVSTNFSFPV